MLLHKVLYFDTTITYNLLLLTDLFLLTAMDYYGSPTTTLTILIQGWN